MSAPNMYTKTNVYNLLQQNIHCLFRFYAYTDQNNVLQVALFTPNTSYSSFRSNSIGPTHANILIRLGDTYSYSRLFHFIWYATWWISNNKQNRQHVIFQSIRIPKSVPRYFGHVGISNFHEYEFLYER